MYFFLTYLNDTTAFNFVPGPNGVGIADGLTVQQSVVPLVLILTPLVARYQRSS